MRVNGDTVSYVVNGTVVQSGPKGALKTDGLVGVRINHVNYFTGSVAEARFTTRALKPEELLKVPAK